MNNTLGLKVVSVILFSRARRSWLTGKLGSSPEALGTHCSKRCKLVLLLEKIRAKCFFERSGIDLEWEFFVKLIRSHRWNCLRN